MSLLAVINSGNIFDLFNSMAYVYQITYSLDKQCEIQETFFELTTWCIRANCTADSLILSFQKNIFSLIGSLNSLAEIITQNS